MPKIYWLNKSEMTKHIFQANAKSQNNKTTTCFEFWIYLFEFIWFFELWILNFLKQNKNNRNKLLNFSWIP